MPLNSIIIKTNKRKVDPTMLFKIMMFFLALFTTPTHAIVTEQTYEGYSEFNDYYIIDTGTDYYEIESDDLVVGDEVTVYFIGEYPVKVLYGWR